MPSVAFILFSGPDACRIARCEDASVAWLEAATIGEVRSILDANGFAGQPVTLAIASGDCLSAQFSTDGLPRADRRAMLFRFEEKLPIAAEEIVADFITPESTAADADVALGLCVRLDRVRPTVELLEAAGVPVRSIVPAAIAAAAALHASREPIAAGLTVMLIAEPSVAVDAMISIVAMRDGEPFDWAYVPSTFADLRLAIDWWNDGDVSPRVIAAGVDRSLTDALTTHFGWTIEVGDVPAENAAARFCAQALAGRGTLPIDFRRDGLAADDSFRRFRSPANALLAAVAIALAVTAAALLVRAHQYARVDAELAAQTSADFRSHFPDWPMPSSVRAVIESEHRRAAASNADASPSPRATRTADPAAWYGTAFAVFHDVVVSLPTDGRYSMDRMSFQDASFELVGRLQSYDQVDAIAAAARRSGMDVAPPQTRRDAGGGWTFVVVGARAASNGGAR